MALEFCSGVVGLIGRPVPSDSVSSSFRRLKGSSFKNLLYFVVSGTDCMGRSLMSESTSSVLGRQHNAALVLLRNGNTSLYWAGALVHPTYLDLRTSDVR